MYLSHRHILLTILALVGGIVYLNLQHKTRLLLDLAFGTELHYNRNTNTKKVAIVTGSNKGIGFATVQGLAKKFDGDVLLTARSEERGKASLQELQEQGYENIHFHQLDIDDEESVRRIRDFMMENYGGIDVLVNNAAISFGFLYTEPFAYTVKVTLATNYFNTKQACDILFKILKPGARVVNVSSSAGWLSKQIDNAALKQKLTSTELTMSGLDKLMNQYVRQAERDRDLKAKGYLPYHMSKVGLSALSILQQREFDKNYPDLDYVVNHVHPGSVDTDMTNHTGIRTLEEGARSSIFAALLPPKTEIREKFIWEDCTLKDWVNLPEVERVLGI